MSKDDPMEDAVERWLIANDVIYTERDTGPARLDFYLPEFDVHIEVKQFHTPRISEQMGRAENVIAIQGKKCLAFLEQIGAKR